MKAQLAHWAAREHHRKRRERLRSIRAELRQIRERRRELVRRVRLGCKASRERARAAARAYRAAELARIRLEVKQLRQAERNRCRARVYAVRSELGSAAARKREEARALRELEAGHKAAAEHARAERSRLTARERLGESDDEVRRNIEPELVPIFERVKRTIHAGPKQSRTEAFLRYVEENPDELYALREELAARKVAELVREHEREALEAERAKRKERATREKARKAMFGMSKRTALERRAEGIRRRLEAETETAPPPTRKRRRAELEPAPF